MMPRFRSGASWRAIAAGAALSEWRVNHPERKHAVGSKRVGSKRRTGLTYVINSQRMFRGVHEGANP
jgi:hypothetical protein